MATRPSPDGDHSFADGNAALIDRGLHIHRLLLDHCAGSAQEEQGTARNSPECQQERGRLTGTGGRGVAALPTSSVSVAVLAGQALIEVRGVILTVSRE